MSIKHLLLVFVLLTISTPIFGQSKLDSLQERLSKKLSTVEEIKARFDIAEQALRKRNWKLSEEQTKAVDRLLKKSSVDSLVGINHFLKGKTFYFQSQFDKAIDELEKAARIYKRIGLEKKYIGSQLQMGNVYLVRKDNLKAMEYYSVCVTYYEKENDTLGLTNSLTNMGMLLERETEYEKAREMYLRSLALKKAIGDEIGVGKTLLSIGTSYFHSEDREDLKKSNEYLNQAMDAFVRLEDPLGMGKCLSSLGVVQRKLKNYSKALEYYEQSLVIKKRLKDKGGMVTTYSSIGNVYYDLKNYKKAIQYCDSSLVLIEKVKAYAMKETAYNTKTYSYARLGQYEDAYFTQKLWMKVKDSMYSQNRSKQFDNLLVKYETAVKDNENKQLAQENKLTSVQLELTELDNRLQKAELSKAAVFRNWLIFGLVLVLLAAYIIWWRMKFKRNLAEQKLVETEKNKKINAMNSVIEGQENERQRIARELHDSIGSMLSTLKLNFEMLHDTKREGHDKIETMIDEVCGEVRKVAHNMMPEALAKFGLNYAIQDITSKVNSSGKITIDFIQLGEKSRLETSKELYLYRIVQELISNIIKHAKATEVIVQLNIQKDRVNITVEDNGIGFNPHNSAGDGIGLKTIKSRISILNGEISIDSFENKGCSIMIDIPREKV